MKPNTDVSAAPRDGTPVLLLADGDFYPFVGHWARPRRFVRGEHAWLGHEQGIHDDGDIVCWWPLPTVSESPWRKGIPDNEGTFDVVIDHGHGEPYRLTDVWWSGEHWEHDNVMLTTDEVAYWMSVPDLPREWARAP